MSAGQESTDAPLTRILGWLALAGGVGIFLYELLGSRGLSLAGIGIAAVGAVTLSFLGADAEDGGSSGGK